MVQMLGLAEKRSAEVAFRDALELGAYEEVKNSCQRGHALLVVKKKMYMGGKYVQMGILYAKTAQNTNRNAHYVGSL